MKYAIIECANGNYFIRAEGITALESAKTQYHARCQALWNAPDILSACVMIVNEQFDRVGDYRELISHEPQAE